MKPKYILPFFFPFLFLLFSTSIQAQVVINEILPDPLDDEANEFIELYNSSDQEIDLNGYLLADENFKGGKEFSLSGTLSAHGYKVFYKSETKIALNNSGDNVYLTDPDGSETILSYSSSTEGLSISCIPDGSTDCNNKTNPSPAGPNPTPSPTPTLTPIPTNTPTPIPTNSPTPTPSLTPTPSSKPSSTPTPSISSTPSPIPDAEGEGEVLSATDSATPSVSLTPAFSPTPQPESVSSSPPRSLTFLGLGFIVLGLGLFGYNRLHGKKNL